jgi:hypothetical protein
VAGRNGTPHKTQQYEYVGGPAEAGLRREISRYYVEVDRVHFGGEPGKANKAIFCTFGFKSRSQMGLEELGEVLASLGRGRSGPCCDSHRAGDDPPTGNATTAAARPWPGTAG